MFSYLEVKNTFLETIISCTFSDFSKDELSLTAALKLYPTWSLVLGELDPLNPHNEHVLLYPSRWAVWFCNAFKTLTLLNFQLEIPNKKLKVFSSTRTHNCTAAKDTNLTFGEIIIIRY